MMHSKIVFLFGLACAFACTDVANDKPVVHGPPGDPIEGLSAANLERFNRGRLIFDRTFTPEEGLGPLYNQVRCSSCHDLPTIGGTGEETATKATRFVPPDTCDELLAEGGSTIQERSTPLLLAEGVRGEASPPSATARSTITSPSLFGLGLMEAVPVSFLESLADPDDADGDGISGRLGRTRDGRPARFGRKAEFATIAEFVEGALRMEMGLTTPQTPVEETVNGVPVAAHIDPAADPEMAQSDIDLLTDFVTFLGAPSAQMPIDEEQRTAIEGGEQLFHAIGCASCHLPTLVTGPSREPTLSEKAFSLYSDMLLHDLGRTSSSICGPAAAPGEFRTARLAGIRHRPSFLHDGSAGSIWGAIVAHGGEASVAQSAFTQLSEDDQAALITFVATR